jgi:hypothetical protein
MLARGHVIMVCGGPNMMNPGGPVIGLVLA